VKNLFLFTSALLTLGACQKKDDAAPAPSRTALLTARPWRLSVQTTTTTPNGGTPSTTDDFATFPACLRDGFFRFNPDKTLLADEGPTTCNPSDPQTQSFTWDFSADQTKLLVTSPGKATPETDDIIELSAGTLHFRTATTSSSGTVKTQDIIFTAF
jgi:hypothetical protein